MHGPLRSGMSGTCTAECAATWTCSAFRANMAWECLPGSIACFDFPRTAAPPAGTGFSHSGFTAALLPSNSPLNREWKLIPSRTSRVSVHGMLPYLAVDFSCVERIMARGDGVRRITAVPSAGQMMTPDKFLVAEPCPRQRAGQPGNFIAKRIRQDSFPAPRVFVQVRFCVTSVNFKKRR
jgi:hypothetical protein